VVLAHSTDAASVAAAVTERTVQSARAASMEPASELS